MPAFSRTRVFFSIAVLLLTGLEACTQPARPNVLLIVIDTLRPDRLGAYGDSRGLTPFLDSLARNGVVFRNAYSQTSWTNASIASLLTSRYVSELHVTSFRAAFSQEALTLVEVLQQHGYATGGFSSNFLLRGDLGFAQGFDRYQTYSHDVTGPDGKIVMLKARAERINEEALTWLDEVSRAGGPQRPIFLYLHYMEAHNPYDPADKYLTHVLGGRPPPDRDAVNRRMKIPNMGTFSDEIVQGVKDLYDAEVMGLDAQLSTLFEALRARGFLANCLVIVTADHGEEFREHGLMGHAQTLYEEVIRVPLIMLVPGHEGHAEVEALVPLIDLAPTVLDFAGIPPPPSFEGQSLRPLMGFRRRTWWPFGQGSGSSPDGRPANGVVFSELIKEGMERQRPHERAVITAERKLILGVDGEHEFYDLRADPGEKNPNALDEAARAKLSASLTTFLARPQERAAPASTIVRDADTEERMRALGYH